MIGPTTFMPSSKNFFVHYYNKLNSKVSKMIFSWSPAKSCTIFGRVWTSEENNVWRRYKFCFRKLPGFLKIAEDFSFLIIVIQPPEQWINSGMHKIYKMSYCNTTQWDTEWYRMTCPLWGTKNVTYKPTSPTLEHTKHATSNGNMRHYETHNYCHCVCPRYTGGYQTFSWA